MEELSETATLHIGKNIFSFSLIVKSDKSWTWAASLEEGSFLAVSATAPKRCGPKLLGRIMHEDSNITLDAHFVNGSSRQADPGPEHDLEIVVVDESVDDAEPLHIIMKKMKAQDAQVMSSGAGGLSAASARKLLREMEQMKRAFAYMKNLFETRVEGNIVQPLAQQAAADPVWTKLTCNTQTAHNGGLFHFSGVAPATHFQLNGQPGNTVTFLKTGLYHVFFRFQYQNSSNGYSVTMNVNANPVARLYCSDNTNYQKGETMEHLQVFLANSKLTISYNANANAGQTSDPLATTLTIICLSK